MPAGRPPEYDLTKQAKDLEVWSKKEDSTALCQFCVEQDIWADYIYEWDARSEEFSKALKKARMRIAARLRKKLHDKTFPYNYGLFMSELGSHDKFHHDYVESIKDNDAKRRREIEGSKQSTYYITVPHELAIGSNIPTASVPDINNKGSK